MVDAPVVERELLAGPIALGIELPNRCGAVPLAGVQVPVAVRQSLGDVFAVDVDERFEVDAGSLRSEGEGGIFPLEFDVVYRFVAVAVVGSAGTSRERHSRERRAGGQHRPPAPFLAVHVTYCRTLVDV